MLKTEPVCDLPSAEYPAGRDPELPPSLSARDLGVERGSGLGWRGALCGKSVCERRSYAAPENDCPWNNYVVGPNPTAALLLHCSCGYSFCVGRSTVRSRQAAVPQYDSPSPCMRDLPLIAFSLRPTVLRGGRRRGLPVLALEVSLHAWGRHRGTFPARTDQERAGYWPCPRSRPLAPIPGFRRRQTDLPLGSRVCDRTRIRKYSGDLRKRI
jgi:hypothetical protein